jgi:hypothetical protein
MSNDQIKPIKINLESLTIGHRHNKNKTVKKLASDNVKPNLLKRDLLAKIKNYRTSKFRQNDEVAGQEKYATQVSHSTTSNTTPINKLNSNIIVKDASKTPVAIIRDQTVRSHNNERDDDFSQSINFLKTLSDKKKRQKDKSQDDFPIVQPNSSTSNINASMPSYGNLKNGTLPTWRELHRTTLKKSDNIDENKPHNPFEEHALAKTKVNRAVTFKYNLGKKGKTVSVLIKNAETRKKISREHTRLKETKVHDMKSYLKRHNLLKSGSRAPPDVIKKLYEQSLLGGDIRNNNKDNIIHNYLAN